MLLAFRNRTFTVDTAAPETTITGGPSGATNNNDPSFTFSSEAGASLDGRLDGPGATTGSFAACTSPKGFTDLADGDYTLHVRATDAAANQDLTPDTRTFTVDTAAPERTITGGPSGTITTTSTAFAFSATDVGSTFECKLDAAAFAACASPANVTGLANGPHTFDVRSTDGAGNVDATPASQAFTVAVPVTPALPDVNQACEDAKADADAAQSKVDKAKAKLKKAKSKAAKKTAKKKLKKAKAALKKANAAVDAAC